MGAKRVAAPQSPKRRTRQKTTEARTPEPQSHSVALPDWCMPILRLLETPAATAALPVTCREMVLAMLPKSGLNSELGARHTYQQQFLEGLSQNFTGLETGRQAVVVTARASIAALASEQDEIVSKVGITTEKAKEMRAVRDAKLEAWKKAKDATAETGKATAAADEQVKNHEAEHKRSQEELEQLEQLMTAKFMPLKEFSIPGNQWRVRDRMLKEVVDALASFSPPGIEDSLRDALRIAFKRRPGENESFASMTIEYFEKLVSKHRESVDAKIKSFDAEAQVRAAALTAAKEVAEEAKKHQDEAENEYIFADNRLLEADIAANDAADGEKELKSKAGELATALETAEAELARVQSFNASFEALREGSPVVAAVEVVAGEEVSNPSAIVEVAP